MCWDKNIKRASYRGNGVEGIEFHKLGWSLIVSDSERYWREKKIGIVTKEEWFLRLTDFNI